jgi:hypothetical protein
MRSNSTDQDFKNIKKMERIYARNAMEEALRWCKENNVEEKNIPDVCRAYLEGFNTVKGEFISLKLRSSGLALLPDRDKNNDPIIPKELIFFPPEDSDTLLHDDTYVKLVECQEDGFLKFAKEISGPQKYYNCISKLSDKGFIPNPDIRGTFKNFKAPDWIYCYFMVFIPAGDAIPEAEEIKKKQEKKEYEEKCKQEKEEREFWEKYHREVKIAKKWEEYRETGILPLD